MAFETSSTYMNLPIPGVSNTSGPQWATDLNNCLTIVDAHNHTPGQGQQVTPDGLNINADLTMQQNSLVNVLSVAFTSQNANLTGNGLIYSVGSDLWYNNNTTGFQVQLTSGNSIVGTAGSITGLPSGTASASYVSGSQSFVWQSATSTPANSDIASLILRNLTASSKGLTLNPPSSMASDISQTLPTIPAATKIMRMDSSGVMSTTLDVDGTTIGITSNNLYVPAGGIGTTQIAALAITTGLINTAAVTQAKKALRSTGTSVAAGGLAISSSCGSFSTTSTTFVDVTNLSVTIATLGNPVSLALISDGAGSSSDIRADSIGSGGSSYVELLFKILRGSTEVGRYICGSGPNTASVGRVQFEFPTSSLNLMDTPGAGTYTYKIQIEVSGSNGNEVGSVSNAKLIAYEL